MLLADWIELCALFNDHKVDYLLVGGQAVIAHGYPRLTKDLDLGTAYEREWRSHSRGTHQLRVCSARSHS